MKELKLEYLEVLMGNKDALSTYHFIGAAPGGTNQKKALECFRFIIEDLLEWDISEAMQKFDGYIIHLMKLERLADYIVYPPEVAPRDGRYILALLYPKEIRLNEKTMIEELYQSILDGKTQFPREYFLGQKGFYRFCICLCYLISNYRPFDDLESLYRFLASPEGRAWLDDYRLRVPMEHLGIDLLKCVYELTKEETHSRLYYCYYQFQTAYHNNESHRLP